MPMVQDIIQITHNQTFLGQAVTNIYHYYVSTSDRDVMFGSEIPQFLLNWELQWGATVGTILSQGLQTTTIIYDNLMNPDEYGIAEGVEGGTTTGAADDSLSAFGFKLLNNKRTVRTGAKRFAGVTDTLVEGNTVTINQSSVDLAASFLRGPIGINTDIDTSADYTLDPVIVGRTKDANGVYKLDPTRFAFITAAEINPYVTSQVSRKQRVG